MPVELGHYIAPDPDSNGAYLPTPEEIAIGKIIKREQREAKRRAGVYVKPSKLNRNGTGMGNIREIIPTTNGRIGWRGWQA